MPIEPTFSTLFVCTANQCRSPMAEALFRKYVEDAGFSEDKWVVGSAGCWAYPGRQATKYAILSAEKLGTDLYFHESKPVSQDLLNDFNLILCMEIAHVEFIKKHFPNTRQKVFLFTEMINEKEEISDPVGRSQEDYHFTAENLLDRIKIGFEKIKELSA